ncbi:LysR family transcriptional regulator, partial [Cronobacter muytjensii]|uniref:LysR family transcriptional regulator n=1 Tax=Cronobacter muytjensii TaxID=413501 RepID=UPI0034D6B5D2
MTAIDDKLIEFATVRQIEIMDAIREHGSAGKAAKALGVNKGTVTKSMRALRAAAARQGYSPAHDMTRTVPAGYMVKG